MTAGCPVAESSFSLHFAGFTHYADVLSNDHFRLGLKNTMLISLLSVGGTFLLLLVSCYFSMNRTVADMNALFLLCIPFFTLHCLHGGGMAQPLRHHAVQPGCTAQSSLQ